MAGVLRRTVLAGTVTFLFAATGWTDPGLTQVSVPVSASNLAALATAGQARHIMPTAGRANPPIGYLSFCLSFPAECRRHGETDAVALTENLWTELIAVNRVINKQIEPVTDLELYNTEEYWTLPKDRGDCEDYVLLKRQVLIRQGWPSGALLVTVVFDENGDGHAVLIARTDRGEFVLDNRVDAIRIWSETPYRYVKRQSVNDPDRWVAINDSRWPVGSTASAN